MASEKDDCLNPDLLFCRRSKQCCSKSQTGMNSLLPVYDNVSTEVEGKHLKTFIAIIRHCSVFTHVDSLVMNGIHLGFV